MGDAFGHTENRLRWGGRSVSVPPVADEPQADAVGTPELRFAHYRVLRRPDGTIWELGRGAMGVTYKAFDEELRVDVALKVITPAQVDEPKAQALFSARGPRRRARASSQRRRGRLPQQHAGKFLLCDGICRR